MALDSDVSNADSFLQIEFYTNAREGDYKGQSYVKIVTPGNPHNIIDRPVREADKARFPRQWLYFQMQNSGDQIMGTPLKQWTIDEPESFSLDQMAELQILRFQVVEQVANASDSQLQRVGMGGVGLRQLARNYLATKNRSENATELAETKAALSALQEQVAALLASNTAKLDTAPKKLGRPKKVAVNDDNASIGATGHE